MGVAQIRLKTAEDIGFDKITAGDVMKCGVITVKSNTPVYQAIASLVDRNITGLPVVDDDMHVAGIISEKDVLNLLFESGRGCGSVEQFMTKNVVCFEQNARMAEIVDCLNGSRFRRVPILDKGRIVSIISRSDIIRVARKRFSRMGILKTELKSCYGNACSAGSVMTRGLITVSSDTTLTEVVRILADNDISGLPVVTDDMRLEGIVSEKDVIGLLCKGFDTEATAGSIMSREIISFSSDNSLMDICLCLLNKNFRRVPIVDDGRFVGIVSRRDIIVHILKHQLKSLKGNPSGK